MEMRGARDDNPYAEPEAPLSDTPARPAKTSGFTRSQGLTIIVIATILFLAATNCDNEPGGAREVGDEEGRRKRGLGEEHPEGESER